jgi:hypothetical protein
MLTGVGWNWNGDLLSSHLSQSPLTFGKKREIFLVQVHCDCTTDSLHAIHASNQGEMMMMMMMVQKCKLAKPQRTVRETDRCNENYLYYGAAAIQKEIRKNLFYTCRENDSTGVNTHLSFPRQHFTSKFQL